MKFLINRSRFVKEVDAMDPVKRRAIEDWLEENPTTPIKVICKEQNVSSWIVSEIVWRNNREG